MHQEIENAQREIIEAFNAKSRNGIQKIKDICEKHGISPIEGEIASFFHKQKQNLNLESVGDYLSDQGDENKRVLTAFTDQMDFQGQSFTESLRNYLKSFKLPGEAQKIDRLVERFSEAYFKQNPGNNIASQDAVYVLAFQTIMLNTDLHNPSVKTKMDVDALKKNLRGVNNGSNFDENFLQGIYDEIKANPFELNFVKTNPGYELTASALDKDTTFKNLDSLLQSSKVKAQDIFPGIGPNIIATVDKPKSWLNILTGYQGTITLTNGDTSSLVTIQVYKPGFFSKWLFGEQPKLIIQPVYQDGNTREAIDLAAKIAASFTSPVSSIKGTYDYEKSDLKSAYETQKSLAIREKFSDFRQQVPSGEQNKDEGSSLTP